MTVTEFRNNRKLVKAMREVLELDVVKMWFEALESINPVNFPASKDLSPHMTYVALGEQQGWNSFKRIFKAGGTQYEKPKSDDDRGPQDYSEEPTTES